MPSVSLVWGKSGKQVSTGFHRLIVQRSGKRRRSVLMAMPPSSPPGALAPLIRGALVGILATGGTLIATAYVFRAKLIEFFIWHQYRLRLRIESIARSRDGSYELARVRLLAPPSRGPAGERDACNIPSIKARFDERMAFRTFLPSWLGGVGASSSVGLDIDVHEPSVLVEFDNLELTDSNWRRLAREVAASPAARARGRRPVDSTETNEGKERTTPRRFAFERLSVVGNAHLRVVSRALNEVLIPDLALSGGEVRLLELSRSPSAACSELERIAAQRMLAGNLPLGMKSETRHRLEQYAKSVLSKTTEELRIRSREHLERIDRLVHETTKTLDEIGLPSTQREKLLEQSQRLQKNIKRMSKWMDGLDRHSKPSNPEVPVRGKDAETPTPPSENEKH